MILDSITLTEFTLAALNIGTLITLVVKGVRPALKLGDRISRLERHERENYELLEKNRKSYRLLCKAMLGLIDNRITGNNEEGLKLVKADLIEFLSE